jgi:hypothetical protein
MKKAHKATTAMTAIACSKRRTRNAIIDWFRKTLNIISNSYRKKTVRRHGILPWRQPTTFYRIVFT